MLATICDDTWNVLHMQHIPSNLKQIEIIQTSLVVALENINGPIHMADGRHEQTVELPWFVMPQYSCYLTVMLLETDTSNTIHTQAYISTKYASNPQSLP